MLDIAPAVYYTYYCKVETLKGTNQMNFVVIDTETTPITKTDNVRADLMRVYDFGYIIANDKGETLVTRSFVISDTFYNDQLMNSAYYADKLPQYRAGLGKEWEVVSLAEAKRIFAKDCRAYNVHKAWAFNGRFDMGTLDATINDYSNGFVRYFLPYGLKWYDIMEFAKNTICNTKKYREFCESNGYMTKHKTPRPRTTAEIVYRYISKTDFVERHTALADCEIELEILRKCFKTRKKQPKPLRNW